MPTAAFDTYTNTHLIPAFDPESALMKHCNLATGTYVAGTVIGEVTATPGTFAAYATGNVNGTEQARGILKYGCVVDGSGNITLGNEPAGTVKSVEYYIGGYFQTQDLVGLDVAGVADLNGLLVQGTVTTGVLKF